MKLNRFIESVADAGRDLLKQSQIKLVGKDDEKNVETLCAELYSHSGEALGTALAREVVDAYCSLDCTQKGTFFQHLLMNYSVDSAEIVKASDVYKNNPNADTLEELTQAVESPRKLLFKRMNMAPGGTEAIVSMRYDLLKLLRSQPELKPIDLDFQKLFITWFNRGFLSLRKIDWQTHAHILEKLIQYEAVHEMDGWDDLRRRLESDRRCFAFFHPALPDEPLIFVEVALVKGMASAIQPLLAARNGDDIDENDADTAIFYSISNCQIGLKGISFGNFLIKQVVMELKKELPRLNTYATLSPIPGFRKWLTKEVQNPATELFNEEERGQLQALDGLFDPNSFGVYEALQPLLTRLCSHYLYNEKRGKLPLDPVSRFHLGNGARIERLNWQGDLSENGLKQSGAILVNYCYDLDNVEVNHEQLMENGTIAASKDFMKLID